MKQLGNPKDGTEPRPGVMKLCKISPKEVYSEATGITQLKRKNELIQTRGFFIKEHRSFLLRLPLFDKSLFLFFPPNDEDLDFENNPIPNNPNFQFPRLKPYDENSFILSGFVQKDTDKWLAVGKFNGKIPDGYRQYQDKIVYPEDYWNLA